jgi:hypothetical protein
MKLVVNLTNICLMSFKLKVIFVYNLFFINNQLLS